MDQAQFEQYVKYLAEQEKKEEALKQEREASGETETEQNSEVPPAPEPQPETPSAAEEEQEEYPVATRLYSHNSLITTNEACQMIMDLCARVMTIGDCIEGKRKCIPIRGNRVEITCVNQDEAEDIDYSSEVVDLMDTLKSPAPARELVDINEDTYPEGEACKILQEKCNEFADFFVREDPIVENTCEPAEEGSEHQVNKFTCRTERGLNLAVIVSWYHQFQEEFLFTEER